MAAVVVEVAGRKEDGKEECGSAGRRASGCGARDGATRRVKAGPCCMPNKGLGTVASL